MYGHAELVRELKSLRKGRGVLASGIEERVGPTLRAACGISDGDEPSAVRRTLITRLTELAEQLPDGLGRAALVAFAIEPEARRPRYQDRVLWAAVETDRDERTVRRRVDEAIRYLAELMTDPLTGRTAERSGDWYTTELRVAAVLDQEQPDVLEQHRIIAGRNGLHELELTASVPAARRDVDVRALYGGTLIDRGDRLGFALALPEPVGRGESHDFAVRFRLATAHAMPPYLVFIPTGPCELFELRVRFGGEQRPLGVWRLDNVQQRDVSDPLCHCQQYLVDRAGEVHLRFTRLTPGLVYGVRWEQVRGTG
ncbi:hypothetical protein [Goodfellowiella coeruleoviolacea]|uniref:Uncharacterized protein n=1 Tax=Goodfellowiella coeruleoviolacea TaxID=334858 RepID=A0AAE3GGI4_9PSEU|nr:hypothetical protein [Goodfellowiella coeruleoviolacea]MCP2167253.1 hypothetical protein [Goodfellowiella coeruleoviolacea]